MRTMAAAPAANGSAAETADGFLGLSSEFTLALTILGIGFTALSIGLTLFMFLVRRQDRQFQASSALMAQYSQDANQNLFVVSERWARTEVRLAAVVSELTVKGFLGEPERDNE